MEIHIRLAGIDLGPYTRHEVKAHLVEGLLSAKDLARLEGTDQWQPVGDLLANLPPEPEPVAKPIPAPLPEPPESETPFIPPPRRSWEQPPPEPPRQALPLRVKSLDRKTAAKVSPSQALSLPGSFPDRPMVSSGRLNPNAVRAVPRIKSPEPATPLPLEPANPAPPRAAAQVVLKKPAPEANRLSPSQALNPSTVRALVKTVEPGAKPATSGLPAPPTTPTPAEKPPAGQIRVASKKITLKPSTSAPIQLAPLPTPVIARPVEPEPAEPPVRRLPPSPQPLSIGHPSKRPLVWIRYLAAGGLLLILLVSIYLWLPYRSANTLWNGLENGQPSQLAATIDFPALRQSLKDQLKGQLGQAGLPEASVGDVEVMIENSIDLYVTPEGIARLSKKLDAPVKTDQVVISQQVAANLLFTLTNPSARNQHLAALNDFIIDLDSARLHLQPYGLGWKLNRIELEKAISFAPVPASPAAPVNADPSSPTPTPSTPALTAPVVETYIAEGKAKYLNKDFDGAIASFDQVIALNPRMAAAYNNRAFAKQDKGDLDGAIADFSQALSLDPQLAEVYFARSKVKMTKGDAEGAMADLNQAISINPKLEGAYFERGNGRAAKGDFDGAIADFTEVVTLNPNQADAYANRGFAERAKNDIDGAIRDYTQAIAIDPKMAGAYYNRGLARQSQGNIEGAILDFNQTLDLDPKMFGAYFNRGNAKNTKHDLDGAIGDYNQAILLDPNVALAYCYRGVAKQSKEDIDGALADYTQALTLDPKLAHAYYSRGLMREQKDDLDGAIDDSTHALELDPNEVQAYYNRGFAELTRGKLDNASADFRKFCELVPRDHYSDHARVYLWLIAQAQGKPDANQALADALQSNWNSAPDDLVSKIALFLLDRLSENELISAASSPDVKRDQGQHCEVLYFVGMKRLLAGDRATAIDYFHRCLTTDKKDYCEYILAKAELQALAPNLIKN